MIVHTNLINWKRSKLAKKYLQTKDDNGDLK